MYNNIQDIHCFLIVQKQLYHSKWLLVLYQNSMKKVLYIENNYNE